MSEQYLWHLTLATGHTRRSWRHEIDPEAMAATRGLLQAALAAERAMDALCEAGASAAKIEAADDSVPIPGIAGARLSVVASTARCVSLYLQRGGIPLITMGVADHQRCAAGLWRTLTEIPTMQGAHLVRPDTPWCAVRIHESMHLAGDAMHWLGDAERCLAWAWLDLSREARA